MGFALQMAGSVGSFDDSVTQQLSAPPGIASALKPGQGRGFMALMQLPSVLAKAPPQTTETTNENPSDHPNTPDCPTQQTQPTDSPPICQTSQ